MYNAKAYSATGESSPLGSTTIARRDPNEHDVQIEILFCGICHSDLRAARNEWSEFSATVYPIVPGHEIIGRVTKVGAAVTKFKIGDLAAVGCMVDSDRTCNQCKAGLEQYCPNNTLTYNSPDEHLGGVTYGGYSESIVVDEHFVLRVPSNLELPGVAPLLCAGVTTYKGLKETDTRPGEWVVISGVGGLGHLAVQYAKAMGLHVAAVDVADDKLALGNHRRGDHGLHRPRVIAPGRSIFRTGGSGSLEQHHAIFAAGILRCHYGPGSPRICLRQKETN